MQTGSQRVLVVNDDPLQLQSLAQALQSGGYRTLSFQDPEEALQHLQDQSVPDIIITDLHMPVIDGWRFCRLLRSSLYPQCNDVPILLISTTYEGHDVREMTTSSGANDFLRIPVEREELLAKLEQLSTGRVALLHSKVLIVEDSRTVMELLSRTFQQRGYEVFRAGNGSEAQTLFAENDIDTVILDYHLPDIQGDQLLASFRQQNSSVVCLMATTDPNPSLAVEWLKAGANGYVHKPFDPNYVVSLCEHAHREQSLLRFESLLDRRTRLLQASEERYRRIYLHSPELMFTINSSGHFCDVNNYWLEVTGHTRSTLIGRAARDVVTGTKTEDLETALLPQLWEEGGLRNIPLMVTCQGRQSLETLANATVIVEPTGEKTALFVLRDLTAQRRAEQALQEHQARLALAIQGAGLGCYDWNIPSGEISVDQRWAEMLGYHLAELKPNYRFWMEVIHPEDRVRVEHALNQHLSGETSLFQAEYRIGAKSGEYVWVMDCGKIIVRDNEDYPQRMSGIHLNITEQKTLELERHRLELNREQTRKYESLVNMAGSIAHHFNNIMMVIQGYLELVDIHVEKVPEVKGLVNEISKASHRASQLSTRMLTYVGQGVRENLAVELVGLLRKVVDEVQAGLPQDITISSTINVSEAVVKGDPNQISIAVAHLLRNAVESYPGKKGIITIMLSCVSAADVPAWPPDDTADDLPVRYWAVEVTDHGSGMSPEVLSQVFDPFFTTKFVGRGLGMSEVLGIARAHRAKLKLKSQIDLGTQAWIYFPDPND